MSHRELEERLRVRAESLKPESIAIRRDLHAHPELGFEETRTSGIVADYLRRLGCDVETKVGRTGVVGVLRGSRPGRTILVRADMDALPIYEENTHDYVSRNDGVMHACGHDGHTTIGLMTANLLSGVRDAFAGTVKFAFQPAEETLGGAKAMIADGVLERPYVDACIGLHLWSGSAIGTVSTRPGPLMAAADTLRITIRGKGGHAAMPHNATDAILAAAQTLVALQTVVSRNVNPLDAALISFGMIHGGTAVNVLPEEVALGGTVRTFKDTVRKTVLRRIEEVVHGVAATCGTSADISLESVCGPTDNDVLVTNLVLDTAKDMFGEESILPTDGVMGSEDMSFFLEKTPGCYFFIGAGKTHEPNYPHHNPRFDFNEDVMPLGASLMSAVVLRYLNS
jgi:amidohydrolase